MNNHRNETTAIVSNTSWSIYNFRKGLLTKLQLLGTQIIIIAPEDDYSKHFEEMGLIYIPIQLDNYGTNPLKDLLYSLQIFKILLKYRVNFLISYTIKPNIFASFAASLLSIPCLAVITGLGHLFTHRSWKTRIAKSLYKIGLRNVKEVWFLNNEDKRTFLSEGLIKTHQASVLPSEGVDTDYFAKDEKAGRTPQFNFLFAGRLIAEKGIKEFVKAAKMIKQKQTEIQFNVLGFINNNSPHAISKKQMESWHQEGLINFLGATSNIKSYLDCMDCVVLPTYYREGVPRILLEASSMEIPIITTDNVGCREVIDHGVNGYVCQPKNVESLAYWMQKMMDLNEKERDSMGIQGRKIVKNLYDESIIIAKYQKLLAKHLEKLEAPAPNQVPANLNLLNVNHSINISSNLNHRIKISTEKKQ